MRLDAGTRLGTFEILAPLGAGGMGEVYRARDRKLGREVAIKVLPRSVASDPAALARFQVEARSLAALSHPSILSIHDLGVEEGVTFVVMELLEGETLRARLGDGIPLPRRKAVAYAREIALGLQAAHEKGIVHRDLKPENVFVTRDERVKILDFGLAKRTEKPTKDESSAPTWLLDTEPGMVMGTVGYMAPEQVRGLPVDRRTDLFALGAILYEMLTGKRAFQGESPGDTMSAILRDEPSGLSRPHPSIPPGLERIVRHCLEKSPEARSQSAHDVAFELESFTDLANDEGVPERAAPGQFGRAESPRPRGEVPGAHPPGPGSYRKRLVLTLAALAGGALVTAILLRGRPGPPPQPTASPAQAGTRRLAVLPFENLGDHADDYFAEGITDAVRGKLTRVPGLAVIARASSSSYRGTRKTPREIGQDLGVEYLLTGTVRFVTEKDGTRRVRVSPELSLAETATSRWAEPFDATLTDVFRVQGEIAARVAQALDVELSAGEKTQLERRPTRDLAAYEAYLRGEEASLAKGATDAASLRRAAAHYEQAVALDASFLEAWSRLGAVTSLLYANGVPTPEGAARALEAAQKALALGPDRPEGHRALADYYRLVLRDPARSLPELELATRLARDAEYAAATGGTEMALGRWPAALAHLLEALRLDPRSVNTARRIATSHLYLRNPLESRAACDRALALAPALDSLELKAMTYLSEGDLAGARAVLASAPREIPPTALVAYVANFYDLAWLLDGPQRELLKRLTPTAFDDDRATWAICLSQAFALDGDGPGLRKHAELARAAAREQLAAVPGDSQLLSYHALALAYLGRGAEAIREAERAVRLMPESKDAVAAPYVRHQLARVYILAGEHEKALDTLEPLLKVAYYLTPGWLRVDPAFDPLRTHPRFQRLVATESPTTRRPVPRGAEGGAPGP